MKSAKPSAADASSQRRSQPLRQTRTNPPRSSANATRGGGGRDSLGSGPVGNQPIDIFPAITHFADAMTALPKELVRHFTLLKEVDAKIFAPEEQLFTLVSTAANIASLPGPSASIAPTSAPMSAQNSSSGIAPFASAPSLLSADDGQVPSSAVRDHSNLHRRQHFRDTAIKVQQLLVALEEKNHVISTANDALQRQLARIDDVWPYVQSEFSDEAKWGSTSHWAYPENRTNKVSNAERARRDGAAVISAAAQALVDEAAARSDARKQAVQAKKSLKNQQQESEHDDPDARNKGDASKKTHQSKVRRTAETTGVGLGITTSASTNGNPAPKRRKVEKVTNGGAPMERAMSSVFGNSASKAKVTSPQLPPAPDGPKKRKALPSSSGQSKKRTAVPGAASTSATSSPVLTALPEPKAAGRASPALKPSNATTPTSNANTPVITAPSTTTAPAVATTTAAAPPRPSSSRARQNSIQSVTDSGKAKPASASSTSIKSNGNPPANPETSAPVPLPRTGNDPKPPKETPAPVKADPVKSEVQRTDSSASAPVPAPALSKKDAKVEEPERKSDSAPPAPQAPPTVTTKSGRASKPSTPAMATFQEAARPRSSRNADSGGVHKKGHRKSNSVVVQPLAPPTSAQGAANAAYGDDDDVDIDADEPTYCYCNSVSYGEMVACDAPGCQREWFHLACVGLKVAPGSKTKWYCEDCKERLKLGGKKIGGR
ncbi:hypothetical protein S7711_06173 [Stachybotrys chartarum IBT 7711]|uniref:Chromatin modification-related protein n=1 Tax=Stachybotrys chartarum (strain CBS 109288 / IBT 7711) TaxID=1280523 RepID=A0A084AMA4_STACB|nr:hypothetical protein S7711_06173 [Stachybotrys chartarum IBT 7711]KFA50325.1 hypothetical protein S40293_03300 [Stachybotrys chartarum IBT 40293]KFA77140.1 hypothetical protein S40288_05275 [Stachybotrys chartarum IBT 40288]